MSPERACGGVLGAAPLRFRVSPRSTITFNSLAAAVGRRCSPASARRPKVKCTGNIAAAATSPCVPASATAVPVCICICVCARLSFPRDPREIKQPYFGLSRCPSLDTSLSSTSQTLARRQSCHRCCNSPLSTTYHYDARRFARPSTLPQTVTARCTACEGSRQAVWLSRIDKPSVHLSPRQHSAAQHNTKPHHQHSTAAPAPASPVARPR